MDKTQAAEIQRHLLDAVAALDRAHPIIFADRENRELFAEPFNEIAGALQFGLLQTIYDRYPDLRPPDDDSGMINTTVQWEELVLPDSVSEADLDSIIFSFLRSSRQKTARVLSDVWDRCEALALPVDHQVIGARIVALAEAGRLEAYGDLRKWRYSEIRLNAQEEREV